MLEIVNRLFIAWHRLLKLHYNPLAVQIPHKMTAYPQTGFTGFVNVSNMKSMKHVIEINAQ